VQWKVVSLESKSATVYDVSLNNYLYHTIKTAAMSNGKIVDTCAKLSQAHMYMESD
jgi:hypothetical protein